MCDQLKAAQKAIEEAQVGVILTGAGMSASSGLPTFRGKEGFWEAYPPYKNLGIEFEKMASPNSFERHPELAVGFYGHRLTKYRETNPHKGYALIDEWIKSLEYGGFIVTSNVDGHHFVRKESPVYEVHGSINHWQCIEYKCALENGLLPSPTEIKVDMATMEAEIDENHKCPICQSIIRPNILMFDDWSYVSTRENTQAIRYSKFKNALQDNYKKGVVIEIGAGSKIPTIRFMAEACARDCQLTHIIINAEDDSNRYQRAKNSIFLVGDAEEIIKELLF
ncbi:NAD-dependent protein deacetylase of SIR2 family [Vibrio chagasii]|nr:NAD-dependent protein deacetylase of SIR2 family [Vibrio chagasii]